MEGVTIGLASWAAGVGPGDLEPALIERVRAAFVDTAAAILSGVGEPVSRAAAAVVAEDGCAPRATQLGPGLRTSVEGAAFLNAVSGHAIDYDDVSQTVVGHPSVVLLPAGLAVGEAAGASGAELVAAYAVGFEVMARLSRALGPAHYARGWHATSTLGTLAAAIVAGRLLGLDGSAMAHALAIAVSEAAGSKANFGTMTKPFHAGHAARSGVNAARLAAAGLTGDRAVLEAPLGFFALYGGEGTSPARALDGLGRRWDLLESGVSVKKYPCCFAIHRAADAVLELRADGLRPEEVESVAIRAPVGAYSPLNRDWAETGLEGKFSMRYAIAAALLDGRLGLDAFTDEAVRRPQVRELMRAVSWTEDPSLEGGDNPIEGGRVEVEVVAGGRRLQRRVERPLGSAGRPLGEKELGDKFLDCARGVLPEASAGAALAALRGVDSLAEVRDLVGALVSPA